jgi:hypothetical protein
MDSVPAMKKLLIAIALTAMASVACKKEEAAPPKMEPKKEMMAQPEKKEAAPEAAEAPAPAGDSIGIAECDDYVTKMRACIEKMPAEVQAATKSSFDQSIAAWKQAATNEAAKSGVQTACKTAADALAQNPACK